MFGSILLLFFLPWLDRSPVRSGAYRPVFKRFFWLLVIDVLVLGYVGGAPLEVPYVMLGQIAAAYYFLHFLVILPLVSCVRDVRCRCRDSITRIVLHGEEAEAAPAGQQTARRSAAAAAANKGTGRQMRLHSRFHRRGSSPESC